MMPTSSTAIMSNHVATGRRINGRDGFIGVVRSGYAAPRRAGSWAAAGAPALTWRVGARSRSRGRGGRAGGGAQRHLGAVAHRGGAIDHDLLPRGEAGVHR